jgi:hypothetical protein
MLGERFNVTAYRRWFMKNTKLASAVQILSLLLTVAGSSALAGERKTAHFSGLINDYSPQSTTVKGSPWDMHGQWSMDISLERETADFAADMTMSGYGMTSTGAVDPTHPLVNPHTHHIQLKNAKIIWDITGCPVYAPPVTTTGFQLKGTVSLMTGNGSIAPFETDPPSSTLQVCVTGASAGKYTIEDSNITLVFGGPATMHFGPQPLHGVVRKPPADRASW